MKLTVDTYNESLFNKSLCTECKLWLNAGCTKDSLCYTAHFSFIVGLAIPLQN